MLNLKSLITSIALVAGTSTAALANPATFSFGAKASVTLGSSLPGPVVRDHRTVVDDDCSTPAPAPVPAQVVYEQPGRAWRPEPVLTINNTQYGGANIATYIGSLATISAHNRGLIALTEPTKVGSAGHQGREDFRIAGRGRFDTLQLRSTTGSTFVSQVRIQFMDGSVQAVPFNSTLDRNHALTIDVNGQDRQIQRILVYGATANNSAYEIFAS